jgi:hypothetical protein
MVSAPPMPRMPSSPEVPAIVSSPSVPTSVTVSVLQKLLSWAPASQLGFGEAPAPGRNALRWSRVSAEPSDPRQIAGGTVFRKSNSRLWVRVGPPLSASAKNTGSVAITSEV